jgi:hypothetical protein
MSTVHKLYVMQVDLQHFLESDLNDAKARREAKQAVNEFTALLKKADWSFMGGEDVLEELQRIRDEVAAKIRKTKRS